MIDHSARHAGSPRDRSAGRGPRSGPLVVARVVAAGLGALLLAAAVGSAFGLAIAKARQAGVSSLENPWTPQDARSAR